MIEFSHYAVRAALERTWELLLTLPLDRWEAGLQAGKILPLYTDMYNRFVTHGEKVSFITAWNPRMFEMNKTFITVSLEAESTEGQVFNHGHATPFDASLAGMYDTYTVQVSADMGVYIVSPVQEVVTFLHRFARRALLNQAHWICKEALLDSMLVSGSVALECPPELVREGIPTMFGRRIGVAAMTVDTTQRIGLELQNEPRKPVAVHDENTLIDSVVDRETRTETDLGAVYPGEVRIR